MSFLTRFFRTKKKSKNRREHTRKFSNGHVSDMKKKVDNLGRQGPKETTQNVKKRRKNDA